MAKRRPRDIGTAFESQVRELLRDVWPRMRRSETTVRYGGAPDFVDDAGVCPWAVEAKASPKRQINTWWPQVCAAAALGWGLPVLVMRRHGHPDNPFVLTDMETFVFRERQVAELQQRIADLEGANN